MTEILQLRKEKRSESTQPSQAKEGRTPQKKLTGNSLESQDPIQFALTLTSASTSIDKQQTFRS